MNERFSVHRAENGEWFYSFINQDGLVNVGWWKSKEEASAAAEAMFRDNKVEPPKMTSEVPFVPTRPVPVCVSHKMTEAGAAWLIAAGECWMDQYSAHDLAIAIYGIMAQTPLAFRRCNSQISMEAKLS